MHPDENLMITIKNLYKEILPVGMTIICSFDPNIKYPGTRWAPLPDNRYLLNDFRKTPGTLGGSLKITEGNLPSHRHWFSTGWGGTHSHNIVKAGYWTVHNCGLGTSRRCQTAYEDFDDAPRRTTDSGNHYHDGWTNWIGGSADYYPPFVSVKMWTRIA